MVRPRLRTRSMLVVVALVAIGLGIWHNYWSPRGVWRRAIHVPWPEPAGPSEIVPWRAMSPFESGLPRSLTWPIRGLRINGLDEVQSLEELERAMADPDASIRKEVYGLVADESRTLPPPVSIRMLAPGLEDREEAVRAASVRGLGRLVDPRGPIARKIVGRLGDPSPLVRTSAIYASCALIHRARDGEGPDAGRDRIIAAVLARLDDPEPRVRASTIDAVEFLLQHDAGPAAPDRAGMNGGAILDALEAKLGDPKRGIRAMAAFVLARHGRGLDAVPMLVELATQPNVPLEGPSGQYHFVGRWYPAQALALLADRSDEAAAYLFSDMAKFYTGTPREPRRVLARVASRSPEARLRIERLAIERLATTEPRLRPEAALLLEEIGSSRDVLPELVEAACNIFDDIRRDAMLVLEARLISDTRVLPLLRAATRSPDRYHAGRAAQALKALESLPTPPDASGRAVR